VIRRPQTARRRARGISYVEVVVATAVLTIALVPALDAMRTGIAGTEVHATEIASRQRLSDKMEEILARPFNSLYRLTYATGGNQPTTVQAELSDAPGSSGRRIVNLYRVDGATASSADTGLLRIRVSYEDGGAPLETLKGRWW
jgi:hypothetical protein